MYHGNKSRILKQLLPLVPEEFNIYHEPFLGSGALFLALEPEKAILNDINKDVISVWQQVKKHPDKLIDCIIELTKSYSDEIDLKTARELTCILNTEPYGLTRSSLYMYLKQIHNGGSLAILKNKKYYFQSFNNHGFHMYLNQKIKDKFRNVSSILKKAKLYSIDYKNILESAKKKDFVYLDPPYINYGKHNGVVYNEKGEENILIDLKKQMDVLTKKGVYVMISNSDYPVVRKTFEDYEVHTIRVYRPFKKVYENELVITNYTVGQ